MLVLLIIGGLIIIGVSGFFIFRKKKDKTPKKKEETKKDNLEENIDNNIEEETNEKSEEVTEKELEDNKIDEEQEVTAVDIDTALSDLMDTKSYEFKDKE